MSLWVNPDTLDWIEPAHRCADDMIIHGVVYRRLDAIYAAWLHDQLRRRLPGMPPDEAAGLRTRWDEIRARHGLPVAAIHAAAARMRGAVSGHTPLVFVPPTERAIRDRHARADRYMERCPSTPGRRARDFWRKVDAEIESARASGLLGSVKFTCHQQNQEASA